MEKVMMDWNLLHVGETFGPYFYDVTPEIAGTYRDAVEDLEIMNFFPDQQELAEPYFEPLFRWYFM